MTCPLCDHKCWDHIKACRLHWLWAMIAVALVGVGVMLGVMFWG